MSRAFNYLFIVLLSTFVLSCSPAIHLSRDRKDISPYDFGLATAKSGTERYEVLLKTHQTAVALGVNVDYSDIDTIKLEIPSNPKRIPLTNYNDFKGCIFVVKNTSKACWIFEKMVEGRPIQIDKKLIDAGNFCTVDSLKSGRVLLIIEDENLWVLNRKGHNYGHTRKDILLVENGLAKNSVVMPYNNEYSKPKCAFVKLGKEPLVFKNISIVRDSSCNYLTHIVNIAGADNVRFENIIIKTPESELTDDRGICIYNCTNVKMDNVRIEGTYSRTGHSGYGVSLNNIWNYRSTNMYGKANWGIFGNNNINEARIEDSQINRFDIHCYGRDISFKNVSFFDLYNQYSSVFGTIRYDKCTFTDFTPVLNEGSYNAYVEYNVVLNDCVFNASPKKNYLIKTGNMKEKINPRHELANKYLPNLRIKNLVVNMMESTEDFYVFYGNKAGEGVMNVGLSSITIDGLTVNSNGEKPVRQMMLSNIEIGTRLPVDCQMKNVTVNQPHTKSLLENSRMIMQFKANMPLKGGKVILNNVTGIIQ